MFGCVFIQCQFQDLKQMTPGSEYFFPLMTVCLNTENNLINENFFLHDLTDKACKYAGNFFFKITQILLIISLNVIDRLLTPTSQSLL